MCAAVSASRSAATRGERRSAIDGNRKALHQSAQRQLVAVSAESADHGYCGIGQHRAPAFGFAGVDVGEMHFNKRNLHRGERIVNGEAGVTVSSRVHERAVGTSAQGVNHLYDLPFPIALRERELDAEFLGDLQETRLDVGKRFSPIESGFTCPEQIEVGAIDDGDFHSPLSPSSQARNFATSSSDSCTCGTRGFMRGVGIGGVGGLVLGVPDAPLNAPARRDAARLSAGLTVAPANTASREALGAALPIDGALSDGALFDARAPPPEFPAERGGRRRPKVAKNSLTDG